VAKIRILGGVAVQSPVRRLFRGLVDQELGRIALAANFRQNLFIMKHYAYSLLIALVTLSYTHPTAFHSYVSFKGTKQGLLKGAQSGKGREKDGWFEIQGFELGTEVPVDAKSSAPKGARQHNPVVITKEEDSSSPQLLNAHASNEVFETIIIQTFDDQNKVTKTTTLKNALISDIKKNGHLESITFTYDQIESKS
jgi:type VI secretion system Hcp family effector